MDMSFEDFVECIRDGIATGELKVSQELTDFDLAVQYAIGIISERKGKEKCAIEYNEIAEEIARFAPELLDE